MKVEIESEQVVTLLCTLSMSCLMSVSEQIPPKSALATRIRKVEDAIKSLAQLHAGTPSETAILAGIAGWNAAILRIQEELSKEG